MLATVLACFVDETLDALLHEEVNSESKRKKHSDCDVDLKAEEMKPTPTIGVADNVDFFYHQGEDAEIDEEDFLS